MSSKPEILIIPGGGGLPIHYSPLITPLLAQGHSIRTIPLPSIGNMTTIPGTMYDDASHLRSIISELVDEGKEVVLIGHSYGGVPMTQCLEGLSKKERKGQGKRGGVVRLGYMTCFLPPKGLSVGEAMVDLPEKEHTLDVRYEDGWLYHSDIPASAAVVFPDLPQQEAEALLQTFGRMSANAFGGVLTHAGFEDIPVSYLFCERDLCFIPSTQQAAIENVERGSGRKVDVTRIEAGHCPWTSRPEEVVDWVLDVVGKAELEEEVV